MTIDSYCAFHNQLLADLKNNIIRQPPFDVECLLEEDGEFLGLFDRLLENPDSVQGDQHPGQQLVTTIIARYPHITPIVPRDLFWYFGGDCLHFLGDEEIAFFQDLDETYHNLLLENPGGIDYAKLRSATKGQQPHQLN